MTAPAFVHLHNHTDYSLFESTIRIDELIAKAQEFDMPAVAITDSNNMCGAIEFYLKCGKAGIKPIIGAEISVTWVLPKREEEQTETVYKIVLLCMNLDGYRNLCRIVSAAFAKGLREITPVTPAMLAVHSEGLICLSGGIEGELSILARHAPDEALSVAAWYDEHFPDRYYIELFPEPTHTLATMMSISRKLDIPLVASADCRCCTDDGCVAYQVLKCIRTGTTLDKLNMEKPLVAPLFYSPEKMQEMFGDCPEALSNTLKIADRCNLELPLDGTTYHFPAFEIPAGPDNEAILKRLALKALTDERRKLITDSHYSVMLRGQAVAGLRKRMDAAASAEKLQEQRQFVYLQRLDHELRCVMNMELSIYFLVVADYVTWAKKQGIPVGPGRGSVGGSLVAYALGITDIDPIEHGLLFERFLNHERANFPDIFLDFCPERKDEVVHYVVDRYGRERVCKLVTVGTFNFISAMREIGKAFGIKQGEIGRLIRMLPKHDPWQIYSAFLSGRPQLKLNQLAASDPRIRELLDLARRLEGLNRSVSIHAAGYVIAPRDIRDFMPVSGGMSELAVSHYVQRYAERLGLPIFCFLGLKNLTLNNAAVKLIQAGKNPALDLHHQSLSDHDTYQLISSGKTEYIFQFASSGMKQLLMNLKPSCFEDIVAACALYRPGPIESGMIDDLIARKHGNTPIEYILPGLEPLLATTYGVPVYQEQLMQIVNAVAGYPLEKADLLRREMGKRNAAVLADERKRFIAAAAERNSIATEQSRAVFDLICQYSPHLFIKAHAASYALIAYQSAWLKAHYPEEFGQAVKMIEQTGDDWDEEELP
jgi:DNA polymerase III subunit alpha